ncbi:MAG: 3-oxo-tetronate 4-phosphate decarboxylase [Pseudomonadota bacterium]
MNEETRLRDSVARYGQSLFERGLTFGSSGNISVRLPAGGWLMTPTNVSLGRLDPARLSRLDESGAHISGDRPTKETFLHLAMYGKRDAGAVVHLHSTHSVAVSCLADIDPENVLPPLTAYYVMRVGTLPLIPYYPPGDESLGEAVAGYAAKHHAVLLANHGPVVAGSTLSVAVNAIEELEETAKLHLMLRGMATRPLTDAQSAVLERRNARG